MIRPARPVNGVVEVMPSLRLDGRQPLKGCWYKWSMLNIRLIQYLVFNNGKYYQILEK